MRIEYFINGFHQPELSYFGAQESAPTLPHPGQINIKPFQQEYLYACDKIECSSTSEKTLVGQQKELFIKINLIPQNNVSQEVFKGQYGEREGDFSFPASPFPLSAIQLTRYNCRFLPYWYRRLQGEV